MCSFPLLKEVSVQTKVSESKVNLLRTYKIWDIVILAYTKRFLKININS